MNYRKKYHMRAAHPVHSKNHFANYQLSIASRHRCMEVLFHCHLNTEYLLTRNQTGVYEHTLHDPESNTPYLDQTFEITDDFLGFVKVLGEHKMK